jgi:DNA polymerase III delta prime subunit
VTLEEDPNQDRRKRRKTASPVPAVRNSQSGPLQQTAAFDWHEQLQVAADKAEHVHSDAVNKEALPRDGSADLNTEAGNSKTTTDTGILAVESIPAPDALERADSTPELPIFAKEQQTTPRKRNIKVTKNGRLLSSPSSAKPSSDSKASPKKRRGRKTTTTKPSPTVTIIKYGSDAENRRAVGEKIDSIMNGMRILPTLPKATLRALPKPTGPPKPTHPFFLGKATPVDEEQIFESATDAPKSPLKHLRKTAVTPGKLKTESRSFQSHQAMPTFGHTAESRAPKQSGLIEAPWPSKDAAHVRNIANDEIERTWSGAAAVEKLRATRKLKNNINSVSHEEGLISRLARQLAPSSKTGADSGLDKFESVRLPQRLLTTGFDIQKRVLQEIRASGVPKEPHPAVEALLKDIPNTLTPFDQGRCESQSWVHKYAPNSAAHVLQSGKEAIVLRDWLRSLTVMAVQGSKEGHKAAAMLESKKPPKKKRKKAEDDFVVFDDEEDAEGVGEWVELSDMEEYGEGKRSSTRLPSLKRPRMSRNNNVIVISGPHGCGKTSTVYAVAKELGFEVFEINSGSRRSGKDIQDKVGDMTENHLVSQKRNQPEARLEALAGDDSDSEDMSEAFKKELETGRQGTMESFFMSQPATKAKPKTKTSTREPAKPTSAPIAIQATIQQSRKEQKQSLILIEEADVLFEEDQQFWIHVTKLASQSKRPIIITCNSEAAVPLYDLPTSALLRLVPPPTDLATDYLLALAGREGHVLDREALRTLIRAKDYDLRASITELDFWCQMSVGDTKGGLEWIYQRWPPGKDVDEHGRTLRVASQGTYQPGMGIVSHSIAISPNNIGFDREEELVKEAWTEWGITPEVFKGTEGGQQRSSGALEKLTALDKMLDHVSAADIYCRIGLPSYGHEFHEPTDPSLPPMPDRERLNYTIDAPVLPVEHQIDFTNLDTDMFIQHYLCFQKSFRDEKTWLSHDRESTRDNTEHGLVQTILQHKHDAQSQHALSRPAFSEAFDILAYPPTTAAVLSNAHPLTASSFDRTLQVVVEDLAPYVRTIVAHELRLETERLRISSLLSEGGGRSKRPRTTRAARVAQEGGTRETKRRERWFAQDLNRVLVMGTAGKNWAGMSSMTEDEDVSSRTGESLASTQE